MSVIDWLLLLGLAACAGYAIICRFKVIMNSSAPLLTRLTSPWIPDESLNDSGRAYQTRLLLAASIGLILGAVVLARQGRS